MLDGFEAGLLSSHWSVVDGGLVGSGCGSLLPVAHGKSLYFDGCGRRQAVTAELDLTNARYMYLLTYLLTPLVFFLLSVLLLHQLRNNIVQIISYQCLTA